MDLAVNTIALFTSIAFIAFVILLYILEIEPKKISIICIYILAVFIIMLVITEFYKPFIGLTAFALVGTLSYPISIITNRDF